MQVLIAQLINGISLGSIYVLLVTGFNLLLLVAMIIHFSYPAVVVFSMYVAWVVLKYTGNNLVLGVLAAVAASILMNVVSAPLFQKVMQKRGEVDINSTMVLSMGIGMIITDVLSHSFNKGFPVAFPDALGGSRSILKAGLISITMGQVVSLGVGVIAVSAFFVLLYRSRAGRAFRAIAEDPNGARLVGIPMLSTGFASYAISSVRPIPASATRSRIRCSRSASSRASATSSAASWWGSVSGCSRPWCRATSRVRGRTPSPS
jgi:branched-chain amino acid transport system permease protein